MKLLSLMVLLALLTTAACSSLPSEIRSAPRDAPAIYEVQRDPETHAGKEVRWGGRIVGLENRESATWIEVVEQPLNVDGEPQKTDFTRGRFIIQVSSFLDPAIYREGRRITVYGTVDRVVRGSIGQRPYPYPIVMSESTYLWDEDD